MVRQSPQTEISQGSPILNLVLKRGDDLRFGIGGAIGGKFHKIVGQECAERSRRTAYFGPKHLLLELANVIAE
jgi:hypothetical protein